MTLGKFAAASALVTSALVASVGAVNPGISLIGVGLVPGTDLDKSGLAGQPICRIENASDCIDQATLGGFGSAIAYTGFDNVFLTVPDRGPFDGRTDVPYLDRFHYMEIKVNTKAAFPNITTKLLETSLMRMRHHQKFVGSSSDFENRFDPEGASVGRFGSFFVSDEYGPAINEFSRHGRLLRRIRVPEKYQIANPSGDIDSAGNSLEIYPALNTSGRQANRGMEGPAISPNGRFLFGLMQNALIQDAGLNASTPPGRAGLNSRLLKIDLLTGRTAEYVYTLDVIGQGRGVNDIVAVNDHQFLVIERDNQSQRPTPPATPVLPNTKKIYLIDINGATNIASRTDALPAAGGAALTSLGITPVTKTLFIDLLDPVYKVSATETVRDVIAEKIEGLAWGPDLKDGRPVLYVISDNDLFPGRPTQLYAFAVDERAAGIRLDRQRVDVPLFHEHRNGHGRGHSRH